MTSRSTQAFEHLVTFGSTGKYRKMHIMNFLLKVYIIYLKHVSLEDRRCALKLLLVFQY